eukprot:scaffold85971_cov43-Tisochrysis_lutea.AAC.2
MPEDLDGVKIADVHIIHRHHWVRQRGVWTGALKCRGGGIFELAAHGVEPWGTDAKRGPAIPHEAGGASGRPRLSEEVVAGVLSEMPRLPTYIAVQPHVQSNDSPAITARAPVCPIFKSCRGLSKKMQESEV